MNTNGLPTRNQLQNVKIRTPKSCINDEFGMTAKKINVKCKISTCPNEKTWKSPGAIHSIIWILIKISLIK